MANRDVDRRATLGLGLAGMAAGVFAAQRHASAATPSTWERIRGSGQLRIGMAISEPWFHKDLTNGAWSGIGYAAGEAVAHELGAKLVGVETTWGNAIAGLQADQYDVMFVLDATPQRALAVDFPVQPFFYYAEGVLLRDGLQAKTWKDLDRPDIRVGVTAGTAPERDATARLPHAQIIRYPVNDQAVLAFQSGHVDLLCYYHPALVMMQRSVRMGHVVLPQPVRASTTSAGVRREDDKTWRDWLGTTLDFYYVTGQTQHMYEDYLRSRGIDPSEAPAVMREMWDTHA